MLIAVDFDGQAQARAAEIQDIGTDGMLPAERAAELGSAQSEPKALLDGRRRAAQGSGPRRHFGRATKP
jgi:hypothetical protein